MAGRTRGTTTKTRIADVAREAGVSKTAVSFAFNRPDRLNSETASRIREVADSLGYRPHPVARMLTEGRTTTVGLLTPSSIAEVFANPFFAQFIAGVGGAAEAAGFESLWTGEHVVLPDPQVPPSPVPPQGRMLDGGIALAFATHALAGKL